MIEAGGRIFLLITAVQNLPMMLAIHSHMTFVTQIYVSCNWHTVELADRKVACASSDSFFAFPLPGT